MSKLVKSLIAVLGVAFSAASCAGGGSSSPSVPNVLSAPNAPLGATRAVADRHDNNGGEDGQPTPVPAPKYTLFGDATLVHPGNASPTAAQATSTGPNAYGGVDFTVPAGMTFSQLQNLATDYRFMVGSCGAGSPRFSIGFANAPNKSIFVYIGPPPNYTGCPPNVWLNTGNLANPANLVDTSQLPGGTFYDPYASAQVKYGTYIVNSIQLVIDGTNQTAQFDNTRINQTVYSYESAASCKNGGYKLFTTSPGPFKSAAACRRYFNGGKDDGGDNNDDHKDGKSD